MAGLPTVETSGGLSRYAQEVQRMPYLSADEEIAFARRYRESGDRRAADALLGAHLRFVVKIASGFKGYGLPVEDLVAEGNLGLFRALEKFEPERGFRFSTYAMWWVRSAVQAYVLANLSMVRLASSAGHKKLFFHLRRAKARAGLYGEAEIEPDVAQAIADDLGVTAAEVIEMNRRMAPDQSLNAKVGDDEDSAEIVDLMRDPGETPEAIVADAQEARLRSLFLHQALPLLSDRERVIFVSRKLREEPAKLEQLAQDWGISRERVRQIEQAALAKVATETRRLLYDRIGVDPEALSPVPA